MAMTGLGIIDLFLRFAAVGQLGLILVYLEKQRRSWLTAFSFAVSFCITSYLLLTAPIPDEQYGILRGVLLFFTDLTPMMLWALAMTWLQHPAQPKQWPKAVWLLCIPILLWFVYFFGINLGVGIFHDINHAIGFLLLSHIIAAIFKDINDDLNDTSRQRKMLSLILLCAYFILLLIFEFADSSIRNHPIFSVCNAFICMMATSTLGYILLIAPLSAQRINKGVDSQPKEPNGTTAAATEDTIPPQFQQDWQNLQGLISGKIYYEPNLTISTLAERLSMPTHQLRTLLNRHLGYKNFSQFLNNFRIPEACEQLKDPASMKTPILTIALEVGYGSIGPFNRAFKQLMRQTPSEYRRSFLK